MRGQCAVITGLGVVAPGGNDVPAFWASLTAGRVWTRTIRQFDASGFRSRIGAECDFDPRAAGLSAQQIRRMDRTSQFAVVAAREALADSGLDGDLDPGRTAVSIGNAVGNSISMEREYRAVSDDGARWLCDEEYGVPFFHETIVPSSIAAEVAWLCGAEGPVALVSSGCTSGIDAVGYGAQLIEEGSADVVIAGATDAPLAAITLACFDAIKATSTRNDEPERACRPFDRDRDGLVLGEGAAVLVMESWPHALARDARPYCEVAGYAARANAYHMTGLKPDGREMAEAIGDALGQARLDPSKVDYVNAHGSGTKQNDRHETAAFKRSLGQRAYEVPVSSIKSMIGHSLGAIGSIEVLASALAIRDGVVPPTANYDNPDPQCDLDYVPRTAREHEVGAVVSVGSGFGGFQSAIVLTDPRRAA